MQRHTPLTWCPRAVLRTAAAVAIGAAAALASVSSFGQAIPLTITKTFGAASIPLNGTTTLTFALANTSASVTLNNVSFTDTLPAGLVVSTPNGITGTCGDGTATATAGSGVITLTGTTAPPGASCSFAVNVTGTTTGVKDNTVTVTATEGTGTTSNASVTVTGATAPPTVTKSFTPGTINVNGTTSLSFTVTNPNAATALTGVGITDTLPGGMVVATPNGLTGTCGGGTITAVAGTGSVTLAGATLAGAASCTFGVNVVATTTGALVNNVSVTSTEGGAGTAGTATLQVNDVVALSPPTITKSFGAPNVSPNGTVSLSFSVQNPNAETALTGVAFTDPLPSGLNVASPNGLNGTCGGGTIDAVAGGSSVSLSGATIAGGGSCSFTVNVTAVGTGLQVNTTGAVSSTNGGTGGSASATILIADAATAPNLIPTLGGWVLVALSTLLAGGSLVYLRRRGR